MGQRLRIAVLFPETANDERPIVAPGRLGISAYSIAVPPFAEPFCFKPGRDVHKFYDPT